MNLIEKLGLEKCKQIVDGAPTRTSHINIWGDCIYVESKHQMYVFSVELGWTHYHQREEIFSLDIVRTAIADHEKCQHEWNETTSNGDAYRFFVCKHCDSTQNYVPFKDDNPSHFDHCTDIRNHISPNTKVIEG